MKYAIIKDKIIENIIVADEEFIAAHCPEAIECPENFGVGDGYDGKKFHSNQQSAPIEEIVE